MPFLDWVNKAQAQRASADVPYHLLQFQSAHGDGNADNLLIQGDKPTLRTTRRSNLSQKHRKANISRMPDRMSQRLRAKAAAPAQRPGGR